MASRHQHHLRILKKHLEKYRLFTHHHIQAHHRITQSLNSNTSLNYTSSNRLAIMYAMSLTRLYMHVVPVLDIRGMLLIYPPSLNHIFISD
jgi:hypothetical protein